MDELMPTITWLQQHSIIAVTAVFTVLLAFIYWPSRRAVYDRAAQLPFDDQA